LAQLEKIDPAKFKAFFEKAKGIAAKFMAPPVEEETDAGDEDESVDDDAADDDTVDDSEEADDDETEEGDQVANE